MSSSKMELENENYSNSSSNAAFEEGDDLLRSPPSSPIALRHLPVEIAPVCGESLLPPKQEGDEALLNPKRRVGKELFPIKANKVSRLGEPGENKEASSSLVPYTAQSFSSLPLLTISQITNNNLRFAFEGRVLNVYGTFKSTSNDYKKYLKADLADREGCSTITLVVSEGFIQKFVDRVEENTCLRIEGANVIARNGNDGGTSAFSLQVDATTYIIKAEPFDVCLIFMPEIKIRIYFAKVKNEPSLKGTIAFVVIQVDRVKKNKGQGTFEQLTIANGPTSMDLATLSFVIKHKAVYHELVHQYHKGSIVMYVAWNIGIFKDFPNTLSVLDITLLTPVYSLKCKKELENAFRVQISEMCFGKEVFGSLEISNFNGVFIIKKCIVCKQAKVSSLAEGGYCFECGKAVDLFEFPTLEARITTASGQALEVSLIGDGVDKVLGLEDSLVNLYQKNVILTRVMLSEITKLGSFLLDNQGCVIGYNASPSPAEN